MKLSNHNKVSIVGYLFGGLFALLSAIRYFVVWPDMDRAIVYTTIGLLICAWAYERSARWNLGNAVNYLEDQLEAKWGNSE